MFTVTSKKVVLSGGPDQLVTTTSIREVDYLNKKVKIAFGAGYEHFVHNGHFLVVDGEHLPVFQWCERTKIAE
jgi:Family of unknown function (DUF5988)